MDNEIWRAAKEKLLGSLLEKKKVALLSRIWNIPSKLKENYDVLGMRTSRDNAPELGTALDLLLIASKPHQNYLCQFPCIFRGL